MQVIDFYNEFHCLGSECPYTCCKGWKVAVDDETANRIKNEKSKCGRFLRFFLSGTDEKGYRIKRVGYTCPMLSKDKLCKLMCDDRGDLVPQVCHIYPRHGMNFTDYNEITFELSCYEAARLFAKHSEPFSFIHVDEEIPVYNKIVGADEGFLKHLAEDRTRLIDYIYSSDEEFFDIINNIFDYVYAKNQYISRNKIEESKALKLPLPADELADNGVPGISESPGTYAIFPVRFINEIIYYNLTDYNIKFKNPYMFKTVQLYKKYFKNIKESDADSFFTNRVEEMFHKHSELKGIIHNYFAYLILQNYCAAAMDYYVVGPIMLAMFHTQCLLTAMVSRFLSGASMDEVDVASIISSTEKAVRHNPSFDERVIRQIRQEFFDVGELVNEK